MHESNGKRKSEKRTAADRKQVTKRARKESDQDNEYYLSEAINVVRDELGSSHNIGPRPPAE